jgi:transcription-repair coupling factor (superfamily II helicase)
MTPAAAPALVDRVQRAAAFSRRLRKLSAGGSIVLDHVTREAWPFAAALALRTAKPKRAWIVCPDARTQEQMHADLAAWGVAGWFLPKLAPSDDAAAFGDPDAHAERSTILARISGGHEGTVVLCAGSLDESAPSPGELAASGRNLRRGLRLDVEALLADFAAAGYERTPVVGERGQFARRGGIVDVFPWLAEEPLRIEFLDDEIESLRAIDIHTQTSVRQLDEARLTLQQADASRDTATVRHYIGRGDLVVRIESGTGSEPGPHAIITSGADSRTVEEDFATAVFENPLGVFEAGDFVMHEARRARFARQVEEWRRDGWQVTMFFHNEGERERFEELVGAAWIRQNALDLASGLLHRGFTVPGAKLAVLTGAEIFGRHQHTRRVRGSKLDEAQVLRQARDLLREMKEGDLVVHADCGIGKFAGVEVRGPAREEVLVIQYAEAAKLFVPVAQAHLVSRYVGTGGRTPPLNKIGDARWSRTRANAERSVEEFAAKMLSTQAQRQTVKGFSHTPDNKWQVEFEQSFLYRETPDQLRCIEEIKRDMEVEKPMDRLLCGDVGFGKTEVAIRAAFKAVMSGRQVAVLVPTTVLAQQHWHTFRERMSDYPVKVEMLSRLTPGKKEREIVRDIREGAVDIVIGTHRLISKDVHFKNLGLAVIDEEQRFGVKHKERFKDLFRLVDVLTLSATPIPRTLYLALMGIRDMSTIETPPPNRHPVQTTVCGYDERLMRDAIHAEIERGGQVFFLHNRVMTIEKVKAKIESLCPGARVLVGHGQMDEHMLEDVMQTFVNGEADVLVCTTIIESGVDIPNANTIIIDRADRFGLADLYQLRGRVGRGGERAHAWLMLPRDLIAGGDARKRVNAIKQYTALGSGFKIAMRDLEIRGAGNLLGTEQSGHIAAVGFDLYCQMLKVAVSRMQGRRTAPPAEVSLHAGFLCFSEAQYAQHREADGPDSVEQALAPVFIPSGYIEDVKQRITAYRMLGEVMKRRELDALERDWRDQYGPPPPAVVNLLRCAALKLAAAHAGVSQVEIKDHKLMITKNGRYLQPGGRFPRLTAEEPTLLLTEALQLLRSL